MLHGRKYQDEKNLVWWKPDKNIRNLYKQEYNVGDLLSSLLVERIVNYYGSVYEKATRPLLAIGSIMHFARTSDVVWGTGVNGKIPLSQLSFDNLDVRAVRGPMTREILIGMGIECPKVYGDPGILTADFFPVRVCKQVDIGYIPHMEEVIIDVPNGVKLISPLLSLPEFINEILSCTKVISSSLHGVIIAESYGVSAVLLGNTSGETDFKYQDYYLGTGRSEYSCIASLADALDYTSEAYDLNEYKKLLLNSFPIDLWGVN